MEPSYRHLLETLPHGSIQKVKGYVVRWIMNRRWRSTHNTHKQMQNQEKYFHSILNLFFWFTVEMLHCGMIFKNHAFRKKPSPFFLSSLLPHFYLNTLTHAHTNSRNRMILNTCINFRCSMSPWTHPKHNPNTWSRRFVEWATYRLPNKHLFALGV